MSIFRSARQRDLWHSGSERWITLNPPPIRAPGPIRSCRSPCGRSAVGSVLDLSPPPSLFDLPGGVRLDVQAPGRLPGAMDDEGEYEQNNKNGEQYALQAHTQLSPLCRLLWLYLRKVFALRTVFAARFVVSTSTTAPPTRIAGIEIFVHQLAASRPGAPALSPEGANPGL